MNEKLMIALYQKMADEQSKFRDWLLTQPQEEVLNHACEYSIREDILMEVGEMKLSEARTKALLKAPDALADIYKNWSNRDSCDHMDAIADTIEARADEMIQAEQERKKQNKER